MAAVVASALNYSPMVIFMALSLYATVKGEPKPLTRGNLVVSVVGLLVVAILGLVVFYQPIPVVLFLVWYFVLVFIGSRRLRSSRSR
jgi:hypothetical protein